MPWRASDSRRFTKKARTGKQRRQWREVANSVLKRTGDESRAIRAANAVVKRGSKRKKTRRARR